MDTEEEYDPAFPTDDDDREIRTRLSTTVIDDANIPLLKTSAVRKHSELFLQGKILPEAPMPVAKNVLESIVPYELEYDSQTNTPAGTPRANMPPFNIHNSIISELRNKNEKVKICNKSKDYDTRPENILSSAKDNNEHIEDMIQKTASRSREEGLSRSAKLAEKLAQRMKTRLELFDFDSDSNEGSCASRFCNLQTTNAYGSVPDSLYISGRIDDFANQTNDLQITSKCTYSPTISTKQKSLPNNQMPDSSTLQLEEVKGDAKKNNFNLLGNSFNEENCDIMRSNLPASLLNKHQSKSNETEPDSMCQNVTVEPVKPNVEVKPGTELPSGESLVADVSLKKRFGKFRYLQEDRDSGSEHDETKVDKQDHNKQTDLHSNNITFQPFGDHTNSQSTQGIEAASMPFGPDGDNSSSICDSLPLKTETEEKDFPVLKSKKVQNRRRPSRSSEESESTRRRSNRIKTLEVRKEQEKKQHAIKMEIERRKKEEELQQKKEEPPKLTQKLKQKPADKQSDGKRTSKNNKQKDKTVVQAADSQALLPKSGNDVTNLETSVNNNTSPPIIIPTAVPSPPRRPKQETTAFTEEPLKAEKVKSRWRRWSEMDFGVKSNTIDANVVPSLPVSSSTSDELSISTSTAVTGAVLDTSPYSQPPQAASQPVLDQQENLPHFEMLTENIYLTERRIHSKIRKEIKRYICDCTTSREERKRGLSACGTNCLNRLLMIECTSRCPTGSHCTNKRFQKVENAKVEPFKTEMKGWGLRATENIDKGTFVMEYVGEVLNHRQFKERVKQYNKEENKHFYFMALQSDEIIDATQKGNISRFINHSCDPNCETQKWTVNGALRVGFFTTKSIQKNEELSFDYQFQRYGKEAQKCYCGAVNCRGYIGSEEKTEMISLNKSQSKNDKSVIAKRKVKRRDSFEDISLDTEIKRLQETGIKNRTHVLNLARLMVRAESLPDRLALLNLLQSIEERACLRNFLDYHGLRLLWSWMVDVPEDGRELKSQVLQTLAQLPIPNRNMLNDSRVAEVVKRWAKEAEEMKSKQISDQSSQQLKDGASPVTTKTLRNDTPSVTATPEHDTSSPSSKSFFAHVSRKVSRDAASVPSFFTDLDSDSNEVLGGKLCVSKGKLKLADSTSDVFNNENSLHFPRTSAFEHLQSVNNICQAVEDQQIDNLPVLLVIYSLVNSVTSFLGKVNGECEFPVSENVSALQEAYNLEIDAFEIASDHLAIKESDLQQLEQCDKLPVSSKPDVVKGNEQVKLESSHESGGTFVTPAESVDAKSDAVENGVKQELTESSDTDFTKTDDESSQNDIKSEAEDFEAKKLKAENLAKMATQLLDSWQGLKEIFKIPRKQESSSHSHHEEHHKDSERHHSDRNRRTQDRHDSSRDYRDRDRSSSHDRHSRDWKRSRHESPERYRSSRDKWKDDPKRSCTSGVKTPLLKTPKTPVNKNLVEITKISKEERRQMFEMEVAEEEAKKQYEELMKQHEMDVTDTNYPDAAGPPPEYYSSGYPPIPSASDAQFALPAAEIDPAAQAVYYGPDGQPIQYHVVQEGQPIPYPGPVGEPYAYPCPDSQPMQYPDSSGPQLVPYIGADGQPVQYIGPDGQPIQYHVGADGQPVQYTGPDGQYYTVADQPYIAVDAAGQPIQPPTNYDSNIGQPSPAIVVGQPIPTVQHGHTLPPGPPPPPSFEGQQPSPSLSQRVLTYDQGIAQAVEATRPVVADHNQPFQVQPQVAGYLNQQGQFVQAPPTSGSSTTQTMFYTTPQGQLVSFQQPVQTASGVSAPASGLVLTATEQQQQQIQQLQQVQKALQLQQTLATLTSSLNLTKPNTQVDEEEPPPPPSPPKAKQVKLPPNWKAAKDSEGQTYYYHIVTRQTQWDPPVWESESSNEKDDTPTVDEEVLVSKHKEKKKLTTAAADTSSEAARKIKEQFRAKMSSHIVACLNPYRKPDCKVGYISNTEEFKHLARKLTHAVMSKEMKHCYTVEDLEVNESVKHKTRDYVRKYMAKFGAVYKKASSPFLE